MVVILVLTAAFAFAVAQICVRLGLNYGPPATAVSFSTLTMAPFVWLILGPQISWDAVWLPGVLWFMLAGAISPLATQVLLFASALRVGISRASPLRNTSPLFATVLAIAFLGEKWTLPLAAGTFTMIVGASLLGTADAGGATGFPRRYLLVPLGAGVLGGLAAPMRKFGFSLLANLPLAVCALVAGSLVALLIYLAMSGKHKDLVIDRHTLKWFGLSGLCSGLGLSANLMALKMGQVVVVAPLLSTIPLFTVLLTLVFLRKFEVVTKRVILGAASICMGGVLLNI